MRRVLSMILALCLIVGLLPAVAVFEASADVTTRTMKTMHGSDYVATLTASSDGATVTYTKNKEIVLEETDEEGNPKTEWIQEVVEITDEATQEWNAKYYYNAETERFTLLMKGVKVTKACTYAFGINESLAIQGSGEMEFVITEDCYFENCEAIRNNVGGSYRWSHTYVTSENGATLYVDNSNAAGKAGIFVMRNLTINANIETKTKTMNGIATNSTTSTDNITINGD